MQYDLEWDPLTKYNFIFIVLFLFKLPGEFFLQFLTSMEYYFQETI